MPKDTTSSRSHNAGSPRACFSVAELDYILPTDLIAQVPTPQRGTSRLLVVDRATGELADTSIGDLPALCRPGDALVLNDTRVVLARFEVLRSTGGRIEALFLHEHGPGRWETLLKGAGRLKVGERLTVSGSSPPLVATVQAFGERGATQLELTRSDGQFSARPAGELLRQFGRMPLPPYIRRQRGGDVHDGEDRDRYQTIYAARDGAVAAPTAGLHFTPELLEAMQGRGLSQERVTLHVGYGTFAPIEVEDLAAHPMHVEYFEIARETAARLRQTRASGGRVLAVGTTSARVLETAWRANGWNDGASGWTDLFCYPPYTFGGVDMLLTNFHLPRSTLLALVMAFAGVDLIRRAYAYAIAERYRFYSYGDAMLIR